MVVFASAGIFSRAKQNVNTGKQAEQYAGSTTCKTCHEAVFEKSFQKHSAFQNHAGKWTRLESCHGPGQAHVEGGGDVTGRSSASRIFRARKPIPRRLSCHATEHKPALHQFLFMPAICGYRAVIRAPRAKAPQYLLIKNNLNNAIAATPPPSPILPNPITTG